jgi:hypothetical protein
MLSLLPATQILLKVRFATVDRQLIIFVFIIYAMFVTKYSNLTKDKI